MNDQSLLHEIQNDELQQQTIVEVKKMFKSFFKGINMRKRMPYPPYSGCYAYKLKFAKKNDFICARIISRDSKPHYILYIVDSYDHNICKAYDPDKIDIEMELISLKKDDWISLTTIITEKPLKRWEFLKNSIVLSLFQLEGGDWTNEFYPARVVVIPSERPDEDVRGYVLEFERFSTRQIVPESFIACYMPHWRESDEKL